MNVQSPCRKPFLADATWSEYCEWLFIGLARDADGRNDVQTSPVRFANGTDFVAKVGCLVEGIEADAGEDFAALCQDSRSTCPTFRESLSSLFLSSIDEFLRNCHHSSAGQ